MSLDLAPAPGHGAFTTGTWSGAVAIATRSVQILVAIGIAVQALIVVEARPKDLITGIHGMADIIRRAMPPDFSKLPAAMWPTLQTIDIALFGTMVGIVIAVPLALLAAANVTPSRYAYYAARSVIGFTRAVPSRMNQRRLERCSGASTTPNPICAGCSAFTARRTPSAIRRATKR